MHAGNLVELAAVAASQNHVLRTHPSTVEAWGAEQYWSISKARLNRWAECIKSFQQLLHDPSPWGPAEAWRAAEPVLEEIFLSEVCTRVWCATLAIVDHSQLPGELDPVARSVFVGHLEARRRALRLLVFGQGLKSVSADLLNRLRRECECWTDLMLSNLGPWRIARQFAFDAQRIKNFVGDGQRLNTGKLGHQRLSALLVALKFYLATLQNKAPVCEELNAHVGTAILRCLPEQAFDTCGILRPGWYSNPFQSDLSASNVAHQLCGLGSSPLPNRFCSGSPDRP